MNHILPLLTTFNLPIHEPHEFPVSLCTIQDCKEPYIHYSNVPFLCLTTDIKYPNELHLHIMRPYICDINDDDCDYTTGFGWMYLNSDAWVDNQFQPVHGNDYDDSKVIGFIKL